jgi:hypothetical protein
MVQCPPGEDLLAGPEFRPLGDFDGWQAASVADEAFDQVIERLLSESSQPMLAGWIYDSDFAFLTGGGPGVDSFEVVLGEPYSDDGDEEYEEGLARLASPDQRRRTAGQLSEWSKAAAGRPISENDASRIMQAETVFVEEALSELLRAMGLADIPSLL